MKKKTPLLGFILMQAITNNCVGYLGNYILFTHINVFEYVNIDHNY